MITRSGRGVFVTTNPLTRSFWVGIEIAEIVEGVSMTVLLK